MQFLQSLHHRPVIGAGTVHLERMFGPGLNHDVHDQERFAGAQFPRPCDTNVAHATTTSPFCWTTIVWADPFPDAPDAKQPRSSATETPLIAIDCVDFDSILHLRRSRVIRSILRSQDLLAVASGAPLPDQGHDHDQGKPEFPVSHGVMFGPARR